MIDPDIFIHCIARTQSNNANVTYCTHLITLCKALKFLKDNTNVSEQSAEVHEFTHGLSDVAISSSIDKVCYEMNHVNKTRFISFLI